MNRKVIAIDVDLTVCQTTLGFEGLDWWSWLELRSEGFVEGKDFYKDLEGNCVEYNLGKYFILRDDECEHNFWRQEKLYEYMSPTQDAIEVINRLSEDHDIVFVSYCKAKHAKSKFQMLKKYFPNMSAFLSTKEKGFVRCDYFIDDRNTFLNQMSDDVIKFKMNTPYLQDEPLTDEDEVYKIDNWWEFETIFNELILEGE